MESSRTDDSSSRPAAGGRRGNEESALPPSTIVVRIPLVFVEVQPLVVAVDGGGGEDAAASEPAKTPSASSAAATEGHRRRRRPSASTAGGGSFLSSHHVKLQLVRLSSSSSSDSFLASSLGGASRGATASAPGGLRMELDDDDDESATEAHEADYVGPRAMAHPEVRAGGRRHGEKRHRQFASGSLWCGEALWNRGDGRTAAAGADAFDSPVRRARPTLRLESEDPFELGPTDCYCRGYVEAAALQTDPSSSNELKGHNHAHLRDSVGGNKIPAFISYRVVATDATLVHVLPPVTASLGSSSSTSTSGAPPVPRLPTYIPSPRSPSLLWELVGESHELDDAFQTDGEAVLACFNSDAVRQLTWRLSTMLFHTPKVELGSTRDAVTLQHRHRDRIRRLRDALDRRRSMNLGNHHRDPFVEEEEHEPQQERQSTSLGLGLERMLLIHSPHHGEGKTMLLRALLHRLAADQQQSRTPPHPNSAGVGKPRVLTRVLRLGPFIAKYGVYADVAMETWVHCVAVHAVVRNVDAVCLVVDGLEAIFLPPRASQADAASKAAVQNVAAYLQKLSRTLSLSSSFGAIPLQSPAEIPFPVKNRLYNVGSRGFVARIRFGMVATATCADNVFSDTGVATSVRDDGLHVQHLATLFPGRYRVPATTIGTRLGAFRDALRRQRLVPSPELEDQLPGIAATATWARGKAFRNVAMHVQATVFSRTRSFDRAKNCDSLVSVQDFHTALRVVGRLSTGFSTSSNPVHSSEMESSLRTSIPEYTSFSNLFPNVGGNHQAKLALEDALALDPLRRRRLASVGMSPPTGIMLAGPPGTGKTMLAKAVANALRSTSTTASHVLRGAFITLSSSDLVRAEVGEGEKMVVQTFETARTNAPAVVFIDEFQALFMDRSFGGSSRMATALVECMDELKRWAEVGNQNQPAAWNPRESDSTFDANRSTEGRVVVLAATNTPWMIDKAFLRPGRFDRCVQVSLPTQVERHTILRLHVSKMRIGFRDKAESMEAVCHKLAAVTEGFSGADLAALCRSAAVRCLLESSDVVTESHFFAAREFDIRPSSSAELVQRIANWKL